MIDWEGLAVGVTWIVGLSLLLATFSYAGWARQREGGGWRDLMGRMTYHSLLDGGMVLVCLGLLGSGHSALEQTMWGLLAAWFAADGLLAWRKRRRGGDAR